MLAAWGFFLPTGALMPRLLRAHAPLWFRLHIAFQIFGLAVALAGWCIALTQFKVFDEGAPDKPRIHGTIGMVVMSLGVLQPVNALMRPHKPTPGENKSVLRTIWEVWHKGVGVSAIILSIRSSDCFWRSAQPPVLSACGDVCVQDRRGAGALWLPASRRSAWTCTSAIRWSTFLWYRTLCLTLRTLCT